MSKRAPLVVVVPREAGGARLDRFLTAALAGVEDAPSRAELQRWIGDGLVTVDGSAKKASDTLREGAQVVVEIGAARRTDAKPEANVAFEVIHHDASIVVVNKPAGLVVHPARGHASGTLVNGLLAHGFFDDPDLLADGKDAEGYLRPGIVHRLDKGTSGIMVVARTPTAREMLKAQFADHTIDREYEAICVGAVTTQTFSTMHGRHKTDRLKFTSRVTSGKRAVTHVRAIEALAEGRATHVACRLETGRTHQIRMHLSEAKTPILADPLYAKPPKDLEVRDIAETLGHQALHARVLGFIHPESGDAMRFERPPPDDFLTALAALRNLAN